MKKMAYVSSGRIEFTRARFSPGAEQPVVRRSRVVQMDEGIVVNGVIVEEDAFRALIQANRQDFDGATVLLDSSNIAVKKVLAPPMNKKQAAEIVRQEFAFAEAETSYIYDSNLFYGKQDCEILCFAAPESLIESYLHIFAEAGVKISALDTGLNAIAKFAKRRAALAKETFLITVVNEGRVISVLFEKGQYSIASRSRLMQPQGSEACLNELYGLYANSVTFLKSQKSEEKITKSYYIGLSREAVAALDGMLKSTEGEKGADAQLLLEEGSLLSALAAVEKKDDLNFLTAYRQKKRREKRKPVSAKLALLLALIAVLGGFSLYLVYDNGRIQRQIDAYNAYFSDPTVAGMLEESAQYSQDTAKYQGFAKEIEDMQAVVAAGRGLDSKTYMALLMAAPGLTGFEYDAVTGLVTATATVAAPGDCAALVARIRATGLFSQVTYTGYVEDGGAYTVTVTLTVQNGKA